MGRGVLLRGRVPRKSLIVNPDEFAESEAVIFRYRLDSPHVLCGGLAFGALGRPEGRV